MRLSEIKISEPFKATIPSESKLNRCRKYYKTNGKLDREIMVNSSGYLCDGYIGYLILLENGVDEYDVVINNRTTYVFGKHKGNNKEYVWRLPNKFCSDISVGDMAYVSTRFGEKIVEVTRIKILKKPPVSMRVRKVLDVRKNC